MFIIYTLALSHPSKSEYGSWTRIWILRIGLLYEKPDNFGAEIIWTLNTLIKASNSNSSKLSDSFILMSVVSEDPHKLFDCSISFKFSSNRILLSIIYFMSICKNISEDISNRNKELVIITRSIQTLLHLVHYLKHLLSHKFTFNTDIDNHKRNFKVDSVYLFHCVLVNNHHYLINNSKLLCFYLCMAIFIKMANKICTHYFFLL